MDQLHSAFRFFRKHHFWFLCFFTVCLCLFAWYSTSNKLVRDFDTFEADVKTKFSNVDGVLSKLEHPNDVFGERMASLTKERRQEVRKAWQAKWDNQKQILTWPESDMLSQEFIEAVEDMRPIERLDPVTNPAHQLESFMREEYVEFIRSELPRLAQKIGASWDVTRTGSSDVAGPRRTGESSGNTRRQHEDIVSWNRVNQEELIMRHFSWENDPTTLQVLYAQEGLWVLGALLDIIKKMNGDAVFQHLAAIKRIDYIYFGKDAQSRAGSIKTIGEDGQVQSPESSVTLFDSELSNDEETELEEVEIQGTLAERSDADPAHGRYVNKDYEPLSGQEVRADFASEPYLAVAKRIPVRMRFMMDQRQINRLLVECSNSPLTVEIRQIRLNRPPAEGGTSARPATTSSRFGQNKSYGGSNVGGLTPTQLAVMSGADNDPEVADFPFDRPVEIFGIVYIFNPVNDEQLGIVSEGDGQ